jgi:ribosomal protein L30E
MLRRRCLDRIGLARRSGDVVAGFAKVRSLLAADGAALLLHARDAAPDGRNKLARLGHARCPDLPVLALFTAIEQGGAIGRDDVVHMAIRPGGHADILRRDGARLAGLMPTTNMATDERTQTSAGAQ